MIKTLSRITRREPEDPSREQTIEEIGEYYRNAEPGAAAVIRETYAGVLSFRYTHVNEVKPPRVYLAQGPLYGGPAFYINAKSCGKNCSSPTGQAGLVMPSPEIAAFTAANPNGKRRRERCRGAAASTLAIILGNAARPGFPLRIKILSQDTAIT